MVLRSTLCRHFLALGLRTFTYRTELGSATTGRKWVQESCTFHLACFLAALHCLHIKRIHSGISSNREVGPSTWKDNLTTGFFLTWNNFIAFFWGTMYSDQHFLQSFPLDSMLFSAELVQKTSVMVVQYYSARNMTLLCVQLEIKK